MDERRDVLAPPDSRHHDLDSQALRMEPLDSALRMSPKRRELLNWFRKHAQPLAGAYEGALRLLNDGDFPGRVHFIAHAVRDIADRLVFVLDPQQESNRVQYENEMDWIEGKWPDIQNIGSMNDGEATTETVTVNYELAVRIELLVKAHRERRQRPSNSELLFRYLIRNEPSQAGVNRRLVSDFKKLRNWFMTLAHLRDKAVPEVKEDELQSQFGTFEGILHSFVGDFFTGTAEIDDILRQANR